MNKVSAVCDKITLLSLYASIFFLPIASAITEGLFVLMLLSYLISRSYIFYNLFKKTKIHQEKKNKRFFEIFCEAYYPVKTPFNYELSLYVFVALLSVMLSQYMLVGIKGFIFKLLQGVFTAFFFMETIRTKKRLYIFLGIFFFSFSLVVTNGIYQYFVRSEFIHFYPITDGRVTSCFKHANDLGAYLVMGLPVLLVLSGSVLKLDRIKWLSLLFVVVFFAAVFCLGVTYSRGAWLAFLGSLLFLSYKKPKKMFLLLLCLGVFMAIFAPKMMAERTTNVFSGFFNTSSRFTYIKVVFQIIKESPLFGVGLNAYSSFARDYPKYLIWRGYPHNCYLHMAAEIGVLGLGTFLFFLYRLFKESMAFLKKSTDNFSKAVLQGFLAGYFGFLIHSVFDTAFYAVTLDTLMWLVIGLIGAVQRKSLNNNQV